MKPIYFLSDAHLGSLAIQSRRMQERRLVRFLDSIKHKAGAVYLLGDMFDFWHEYKTVVPKGFTRFLGKISELTDLGVEVHYFTGNHDLWMKDYLVEECGVVLHKTACTVELYGKIFYLAHGDGIGDDSRGFRFLRALFHNPIAQALFAAIHPRWGMSFGLNWAKHSRLKREDGKEPPFMGEEKELSSLTLWEGSKLATGLGHMSQKACLHLPRSGPTAKTCVSSQERRPLSKAAIGQE